MLEKDSLIEQKATDEKGQITFAADLPVDGKYYVKENSAPDGFVTTEEVQEFTFEYAGEDQAEDAACKNTVCIFFFLQNSNLYFLTGILPFFIISDYRFVLITVGKISKM